MKVTQNRERLVSLTTQKNIPTMSDNYSQHLKFYQRQGIEKMKKLGGKVIQADEMGLGKTLQILAYIYETESVPCVVVCPASLLYNWKAEIKKWLNCDSVYVITSGYGANKKSNGRGKEVLEHNFIIISYDNLIYWADFFSNSLLVKAVVFDEAHLLKTLEVYDYSKADEVKTVAGRRIRGNIRVTAANIMCNVSLIPVKIFATGTPVCNTAFDVYNFMKWIDDYWLYEFETFVERYGEVYDEFMPERATKMQSRYGGGKNLLSLNKLLLGSYMVRRTKKDVLKELPPKQRVLIPITPKSYIIDEYNANLSQRMAARKALIPTIVENGIDFIETVIETGEKIAVFCVFHETIDLLKQHFGDKAVVYDGRMNAKDKFNAEQRFQKDENIKVFIGNVQAAGKGITLTAASKTLTLEYTDNPADLTQVEDRINRIGQKASVTVNYYMHCVGTIDDDMLQNLNKKLAIATEAVDGYIATETDLFPYDTIKFNPNEKVFVNHGVMEWLTILIVTIVKFCSLAPVFFFNSSQLDEAWDETLGAYWRKVLYGDTIRYIKRVDC